MDSLSLLELNALVRRSLEQCLPDEYWIQAELSDVRSNTTGHCYLEFVQKDPRSNNLVAKARGMIWSNIYRLLKPYFEETTGQLFASGIKVLVKVTVQFHELYGYSLTVLDIDPAYTLGDMARRRREILMQLEEEGVLTLNKELEMPVLPQRIAVISSATAAGYGDFCHQLQHNSGGFFFYTELFPALMQGNQVEESVLAALDRINDRVNEFDVVVIIRGGGATSDLSGFDTYLLAAACAQFPLPVITGIGHERDEHALGVNVSEIEAPFELKDRSRSEMVAEVREKLGTIVGANIEIGQPISHRIDAMLSGTKANIAIKLFGDDLNRMFTLGNEIKGAIQDIPGIADLNVEQQIERPQLIISPKREMLAKFGISLPEFSEFVNVCLAGETVSQVYEKGKSFDLTVRVRDDLRDEMEKIRNLMIDTSDGQKIPLNYIAEVRSAMGPNTISRENVKRKIVISTNVADRDLRSVVNDIQTRVDKDIKLPEGYHLEYGGQFESEQAASRTLLLTSLMSIAVIFLLLYHEFRSVKESAIILINLPLALIGGVFALLMTTGEVSIPAIIGFISLFGIATRNGMLLISHYNHLQQEEGIGVYDSVIRGSMDRLNPILMTALSSALALIPLALGGDLPGNEIQSPMAKVILGGLLTSTFLNGFIIPIVYLMMHRKPAN